MKQYCIGFITASCLTASIFLFMGAKKKTFDDLTVKMITIVDDKGKKVGEIGNKNNRVFLWLSPSQYKGRMISLTSQKQGGTLKIANGNGKEVISMRAGKNDSGILNISNSNGVNIVNIGSNNDGNGHLVAYNHRGIETTYLGTNDINGGHLKTFNTFGYETVFLGTGDDDTGFITTRDGIGRKTAYLGKGSTGGGYKETINKVER